MHIARAREAHGLAAQHGKLMFDGSGYLEHTHIQTHGKRVLEKGRHGDQAVRKGIPSRYLLSIIGAHHAPIIPSVAAIVSGTVGAYLLPSGAEVGDASFGVCMTLT